MSDSSAVGTRTRQPKEMTRAAILERAYEMYLRKELVHGDERLSTVLDSLGYTTGAGYQIWPNQAAFRLDLQVHIAERIDYASLAPVAEELMAVRERNLPDAEHILAIASTYYEYFRGCEQFFLILRFFAMGEERPPEITEALRDSYVQIGWELDEVMQAALVARGRRLRDGYTMPELVGTLTALAEGFALRDRVGPALRPLEIHGGNQHPFAVAMLAVINQYTELV